MGALTVVCRSVHTSFYFRNGKSYKVKLGRNIPMIRVPGLAVLRLKGQRSKSRGLATLSVTYLVSVRNSFFSYDLELCKYMFLLMFSLE